MTHLQKSSGPMGGDPSGQVAGEAPALRERATVSISHLRAAVNPPLNGNGLGDETFYFIDDLWPLRFVMLPDDLVKLAARVEDLVATHDRLAAYHLRSVARYRRMHSELSELARGCGNAD